MNFVRYNPFREFDDLFNRAGFVHTVRPASSHWVPRADVSENETGYLIELELPGVKKSAVNVSLHEGVLRITGESRGANESAAEAGTKVHRSERTFGKFERSFKLPTDVDADAVEAAFSDGILRLTVGRAEQAKPKAIEVTVS